MIEQHHIISYGKLIGIWLALPALTVGHQLQGSVRI